MVTNSNDKGQAPFMKKYFVLFNVASRRDLIYVQEIPVPITISFIPFTTL